MKTLSEWYTSMQSAKVILIGAGEHGRVVGEAIWSQSSQFQFLGFIDDQNRPESEARLGVPQLRLSSEELQVLNAYFVLGVGALKPSSVRENVIRRYCNLRFIPIVHSAAYVSKTACFDEGAVVMAHASVQSGAQIGKHTVINTGAIIEHDCHIGDYSMVAPGAVLGGGVHLATNSYIGLGAKLRDHISVGSFSMAAMGSVVTQNVEENTLVMGVPARKQTSQR